VVPCRNKIILGRSTDGSKILKNNFVLTWNHGLRKSIQPVKMIDEVLACLSVWSEVQMICVVQLMPLKVIDRMLGIPPLPTYQITVFRQSVTGH